MLRADGGIRGQCEEDTFIAKVKVTIPVIAAVIVTLPCYEYYNHRRHCHFTIIFVGWFLIASWHPLQIFKQIDMGLIEYHNTQQVT